jgi:kumamolisin
MASQFRVASGEMMFTRARVLPLALAMLLLPATAGRSAASTGEGPNMVRIPGHVLSALAHASEVNQPLDAHGHLLHDSDPITITIVLKRDDQAGFDRYLKEIYDPHSKNFHRYLKQREIARRFGPSERTYDAMLAYLRANGFKLSEGSANRLTLTVRGTRAMAERTFQVSIGEYKLGDRVFYANDTNPAMPVNVASAVESVAGLSNLANPQPRVVALINELYCIPHGRLVYHNFIQGYVAGLAAGTISYGSLSYNSIISAAAAADVAAQDKCLEAAWWAAISGNLNQNYDPPPPSWLGIDGTGQTIGLVEFDTYQPSDISDFSEFFGLIGLGGNPSNVSPVHVGGGATPGSNQDEVLLDIDDVMSAAPGAKILVYDAPFTGPGTSFQTVFNQMLTDGKVNIISNSWAYCEDQTTSADVQSIDSIFQSAEMQGISVFNGAGDSGSTCLDGSPNTISVPADSPNATAVGGSSTPPSVTETYAGETWWDGSTSTPPSGQGGFGVSTFFPRPAYQNGLNTSPMRSIPDVVTNADPAYGVAICEASAGGCPTGLSYGGTSSAAPIWASFAATLNQAQGSNIGMFNQAIYPFANSSAFRNAASMSSDFTHVGLGSPNLDLLHASLSGLTPGSVSASASTIEVWPLFAPVIPADGATAAFVVVHLLDANGIRVTGKTVSVVANAGSNATITPVSSPDTSAEIFQVVDLTPETLTLTITDTTDSITLPGNPAVMVLSPLAAAAALTAFPTTVAADGVTPTDITVTLQDSLGRPSPNKLVQLTQTGGNSVISGPNPPVTDSNGQIQFTATDTNNETITYSAVDVSDGNLAFPQTGTVSFNDSPAAGCAFTQTAAPGFILQPYATGFLAQSFEVGEIQTTCGGAYGMAWDSMGNLYASDQANGNLYKFPPGGGVAGAAGTLVGNIGQSLSGLVFDSSGNLYGSLEATGATPNTGAVVKINTSNGAVETIASNLTCSEPLSIDPLSGDLFTDDACFGASSTALWRVHNPSASPTVSVYASLPQIPNASIAFAPDGTMYIWDAGQGAEVTGTNGPMPPVVTTIPTIGDAASGMLAFGTQSGGGAQYLITNFPPNTSVTPNVPPTTSIFDLTTSPPTIGATLIQNGGTQSMALGPDGCVYTAGGNTIWRLTDSTGACSYTASTPAASLALTPVALESNPAQGTSQTFVANFHFVAVPAGTPILFNVSGANTEFKSINSDSNGQATFTYTGVNQGVDTIMASATVNGSPVFSNQAVITWAPGQDVTFLTLNLSPRSATQGQMVTVIASLSDVSQHPATALLGQTISFTLGSSSCQAITNSNGIASCSLTPNTGGIQTLSASFAGTAQYVASNASIGFNAMAPTPAPSATATSTPTATATATATATSTRTATATATATGTRTATATATATATSTATATATRTATATATRTATATATRTATATATSTATRTVTATATRTATATPTATATATRTAIATPTATATATPVGVVGPIFVSPPVLDFGNCFIGQRGNTLTAWLFNPWWNNGTAIISNIAIQGGTDFSIVPSATSCKSTLSVGDLCAITVQFNPAASGSRQGWLLIQDNALDSPQFVYLDGFGEKRFGH